MYNKVRRPHSDTRGGRKSFGGNNRFTKSKRNFKSKISDHSLFVKKAKPVEETVYIPLKEYSEMDLHPALHKNLAGKGYTYPTEIQDKTLQESLVGRDILGIANTGTGKTGAFLIPIINQLLLATKPFSSLVVVPTRELANQVEKEFFSLTQNMRMFSICLTGGTSVGRDLQKLTRFHHLVVGTPGRLIDMVKRGALKLENMQVLVLDEFDRMLDMGFIEDVRFLTKQMPNIKQTMLFSATLDRKLKPIIDEIVPNPFEFMATTGVNSSDTVEQDIVRVGKGEDKFSKLVEILAQPGFDRVLIFAETKRAVDHLHYDLAKQGIKSDLIHGDKSQRAREVALDKFKQGRVDVLIATDVAARGLDIKGVSHVINYEIPQTHESYIHRIGRTGRAGKSGFALTFVD